MSTQPNSAQSVTGSEQKPKTLKVSKRSLDQAKSYWGQNLCETSSPNAWVKKVGGKGVCASCMYIGMGMTCTFHEKSELWASWRMTSANENFLEFRQSRKRFFLHLHAHESVRAHRTTSPVTPTKITKTSFSSESSPESTRWTPKSKIRASGRKDISDSLNEVYAMDGTRCWHKAGKGPEIREEIAGSKRRLAAYGGRAWMRMEKTVPRSEMVLKPVASRRGLSMGPGLREVAEINEWPHLPTVLPVIRLLFSNSQHIS